MTNSDRRAPQVLERVSFLDALGSRVLIGDGAIGTTLRERGVAADACLEQLNLDRPGIVSEIHNDYIEAGADIIQTNTFGANRFRLAAAGLAEQVGELNRHGVQIARKAASLVARQVYVAGDIGPLDADVSDEEATAAFKEQAAALSSGGVDLSLLQTFTTVKEASLAIAAAKYVSPETPVVAEVSFDSGGTMDSLAPEAVALRLSDAGADAVGVNCGDGPAQGLRLLREMARVEGLKLVAQPNAGVPKLVKRRVVYTTTAEDLAEYARRFVAEGAAMVGGCCGTSPRHIAAIRRAPYETPTQNSVDVVSRGLDAATSEPRSLRDKLAAGRFVVGVELDPPRGLATERAMKNAATLKNLNVDFVNVGDSPLAEVRMSAIAMASMLKVKVGLEAVVHCSTRDRNIMALQSDMIGAHALGLRNMLCLKGDPHALGSYTKAAAVWDVNALGLMRILKGMNNGHDALDNEIRPVAQFFIAGAVNPAAVDIDAEVQLFRRKVAAGAEFFVSQAVFEAETIERFLDKLGPDHPPIVLGVWPIHSERQAKFLHQNITPVPVRVRESIEQAGSGAEQRGLEQAHELVQQAVEMVQGFYFIPSFGRFGGTEELVVAARRHAEQRG